MLFSNILLAYDGSKASTKALEHTIELARLLPNAIIRVIHVYNFPRLYVGEGFAAIPDSVTKEYYDASVQTAEQAKRLFQAAGVTATVEIVQGAPAEKILEFAKTHGADVIIIGSRGLGGIKEFVLGSVSHNVVQHARIPVLVIK
ncbi:MAG: universal stress protein [Gorillibacterium sp.]|nr:universal stress protein [Gorillibacterium sp.]